MWENGDGTCANCGTPVVRPGQEAGVAVHERARARESQIAELTEAERDALIQPGLFDRRVTNDRATAAESQRRPSLDTASSLLVAQSSETVLLLVIRK